MVKVDRLVPGKKYIVVHYRGWPHANEPWVTIETFLGVTRPGDIYGDEAKSGAYKPLPPREAKRIWSKYLNCKPTWRAIDEAVTKRFRAREIEYGDEPYLVFQDENGVIKTPYYYYNGHWAWGSSANRVEFRDLSEINYFEEVKK